MGRYGDLICSDCRHHIWLGKAIFTRDSNNVSYFHIGDSTAAKNSEKKNMTRALWKFLADHASHSIRVVVEGRDDEYDDIDDEYVRIGGDRSMDISFEEYVRNWDG